MTTDATTKSEPRAGSAAPSQRVFTVPLHRIRRGRATGFAAAGMRPEPPPEKGPSRAALMLALAHDLQGLIDRGEVPDRATLARQLGLTRARITQVLDLLLLAPDIQEAVLLGEVSAATERLLRPAAQIPAWTGQRAALSVPRAATTP